MGATEFPGHLCLAALPGSFAVCRLAPGDDVPSWAAASRFLSVTRSADELSIICDQDRVPAAVPCERGWRCLRLSGALPFTAVGVLAALLLPLARARVPVLAVSTFNTDYLLVKEADFANALGALHEAGHSVAAAQV